MYVDVCRYYDKQITPSEKTAELIGAVTDTGVQLSGGGNKQVSRAHSLSGAPL